jgi:hypothetical protein
MRKEIAYVATAVVIVAVAVVVWKVVTSSEDEAPIIVKNGSMDVLAGDNPANNRHWKWTRATGSGNPVFVHDPTHPHGDVKAKQLLVHVMGQPANGCTAQTAGDTVTVAFDDGFSLKISRVQLGASGNYRLHVESSAPTGLDEVSGATRPTLRHGVSGSGYIASVTVGSAPACTFPNAAALTRICVSPDDPKTACEE